jgi:hypothetical protein
MSVAPPGGQDRIMIYGPKDDGTYIVDRKATVSPKHLEAFRDNDLFNVHSFRRTQRVEGRGRFQSGF